MIGDGMARAWDRKGFLKAFVLLGVALCAGFLGGWAGGVYYAKRGIHAFLSRQAEQRREFMVDRLARELDLSAGQRQKIRDIIEKSFKDVVALRKKHRPEEEAIIQESFEKIEKVLEPAQRVKWGEIKEKLVTERRRFHGLYGPLPPPPPHDHDGVAPGTPVPPPPDKPS